MEEWIREDRIGRRRPRSSVEEWRIDRREVRRRFCRFDIRSMWRARRRYRKERDWQKRGDSDPGMRRGRRLLAMSRRYSNFDSVSDSITRCGTGKTDLLPRFFSPVRPGPQSGSNSFPSSPVIAKSNLRFCSTCCWRESQSQREIK